MEEKITIDDFLKCFPKLRSYGITTKLLNVLSTLKHRGKIIYIDEITPQIYFSMKQGGKKTWEQFCLYRDNISTIKEFRKLIL